MARHTHRTHADARERFTADHVFRRHPVDERTIACQAYKVYRQELNAYFRGVSTSWHVLVARLRWQANIRQVKTRQLTSGSPT